MSHTPHELIEEFPGYGQKISALRQADGHFERLSEDYYEINRQIHRAETDLEPTSDDNLIRMRKIRIGLKDEIFAYLRQH